MLRKPGPRFALSFLLLGGCASDPPAASAPADAGADAGGEYHATVRWTSHGIPHFKADDLESIAYAVGYVESRDYVCILADQFVRLKSERARTFGAGPDEANVTSDFAFLAAGVYRTAEETFGELDATTRDAVRAFTAGYNRYVIETDGSAHPSPCRNAEWVRPIEPLDLWAYYYWLGLFASVDPLMNFIAAAAPPDGSTAALSVDPGNAPGGALSAQAAALDRLRGAGRLGAPPERMGSNGWALGRDLSETGRGMLVVNPHFPWQGPRRFYEHHITVPGVMNAYGAALTGVPLVNIGFNEHVGWTHTVTTANHFTIYRLELPPGKPTTYLYDGAEREMTSEVFSIEVKQADGSLETVQRRYYRSHYGPMIEIPGLDWTQTTAYTFRDANHGNIDLARTWLAMDRAESLADLEAAQAEFHGIPWVNTMATSADGTALFFDASRTPQLSARAEAAYRDALASDVITGIVRQNGAVLLNGSDSTFEWEDGDPRVPGIVSYADSPRLERADFVANANDSHWLTHPAAPLVGFSVLFGDEATPRSPRTRTNLRMLMGIGPGSLAGSDGKFSFDELSEVHFSNRASMGELLRDQVVARCEANPAVDIDGTSVDLSAACAALRGWDLRLDLDSAGAPLFRELLVGFSELRDAGDLFKVGFDAGDPVATPHTLADPPASGPDPVLVALGRAVQALGRAGRSEDAALRDLQYTMRGDERIPIHGGNNAEGAFNIVGYGGGDDTLLPGLERGPTVSNSGLTAEGYPINNGSSFIMVLAYTDTGPEARALLTYSQSADPGSSHFADQTRRFSNEQWRPVLFREEDIAGDPELREEHVVGPR
jgi:acyl-homoserine-lactone acylase